MTDSAQNDSSTPKAVQMAKPVRAFIIGDRDAGLTIVITDPVMVVHYSADDLTKPMYNDMSGDDPAVVLAAVVQDLLPHLRAVDVVKLIDTNEKIEQSAHGSFSLDAERKVTAELDYANTIGRIIRRGGTVCDVDFCVALNIDPSQIVLKGRATEPASKIADYLDTYGDAKNPNETVPSKPQVFKISQLTKGNLGELDPWQ